MNCQRTRCTAYEGDQQCREDAVWIADLRGVEDGGPSFHYACNSQDHYDSLVRTFGAHRIWMVAGWTEA